MIRRFRGARTLTASGRFLWTVLAVGSCQTVGGPAAPGPGADLPAVVVEPGAISAADERAARELLASAQASFDANRHFEALRTAEELLEAYPASEASGEALRLTALAHERVGQGDEAVTAADQYVALLPPGDGRAGEMRLLQARVRADEPRESLRILLEIPELGDVSARQEGARLARAAIDSLDIEVLAEAVDEAPSDGALRPLVEARLAVSYLEFGFEEEARVAARRSLDGGVAGLEAEWAAGVLEGELPPGRRRVTTFSIGAVLPETGPPALADYARGIREGIELAVATVLGDVFTVSLVVADDQADPFLGAELIQQLEATDSVVGIVGFLLDDVLLSSAAARRSPIPIVSPTARTARVAGDAVYSLDEANPAAARSVAEYAASRAFQRIAMLYPNNPAARAEADAFEARAVELGMPVVGRFEYEPGATFFEPQIRGARDALRAQELAALALAEDDTLHMEVLEPAALFMPLPPEDVEFLAPQVIHFGLDTLAIEILGTSGWGDPQTLAEVESRLTDGVVATAPAGTDASSPGAMRFRRLYEDAYQKSLVSTAPAVGYDAALILLEALRRGQIEPERLRYELERLEDIEGATGIFSIVDGRVVRRTDLIRIDDSRAVPIEAPGLITPENR